MPSDKIKDIPDLRRVFEFEKNGFVDFRCSNEIDPELLNEARFSDDEDSLYRDHKDAGALKTKQEHIKANIDVYVRLLTSLNLVERAEKVAGTKLYPLKLMHVISDEKTGTLIWHRDSYTHNGRQMGPIPAPLKLAIYLTKTNKKNGITGFIPGSFHRELGNRYLDTAAAYLGSPLARYYDVEPGDVVLFSGRVMHCRPRAKTTDHREAVIFSLTTSPEIARSYQHSEDWELLRRYLDIASARDTDNRI